MYKIYQLGSPCPNTTDESVAELLSAADAHVQHLGAVRDEDELIRVCADAHALIPMGAEPITRRVLVSLRNLKVVARGGVGVDAVDVDSATALGVQVTNAPDSNYRDVAVHALSMILYLVRGLGEFDDRVRQGLWDSTEFAPLLRRPEAMRLGIVGLGRSGTELATMAAAIGFQIAAHVRPGREDLARAAGAVPMSLDELVSSSHVVSLHVGLDAANHHLVDAALLQRFLPGAMLVNVSRGGLVDAAALSAALVDGRLRGAALDVFPNEPIHVDSPLLQAPRTVLTPHVAYLSTESVRDATKTAVMDVIRVLEGREPVNPVNRIKG